MPDHPTSMMEARFTSVDTGIRSILLCIKHSSQKKNFSSITLIKFFLKITKFRYKDEPWQVYFRLRIQQK